MGRQNTHLSNHTLYGIPRIIPLNSTKRILVWQLRDNDRLLYQPQIKLDSDWIDLYTRTKVWATFSLDNALAKLGIEPCGMWRVYFLNDTRTEVVEIADFLAQLKPTARANAIANGRHYEIIPLR